jgi:hypothetical protein
LAVVLPLAGCDRRPPPDVILVSIDTLRPDHLGCYGYARPTSPELDRFRADATLFRTAIAHAPSTLESHASILTSLLPAHHGAAFARGRGIGTEFPTLAEALRFAGYRTASFNGGGQLDTAFGLSRGFDVYRSLSVRSFHEALQSALPLLHEPGPLFLFLHTYETHHPYQPTPAALAMMEPRGYAGALPRDSTSVELLTAINNHERRLAPGDLEHIVATYDAMISSADAALGELFAALRRAGRYENALIVVTSDHGEEFGEHGMVGWHGHTLYDELLRVPLLIHLPGGRAAGRESEVLARGIDIGPTILAALGRTIPAAFEGQDLFSRREDDAEAYPALSRLVTGIEEQDSIRTRDWKLVDDALFDLRHDPGEKRQVKDARRAAQLGARRAELLARAVAGEGSAAQGDAGLAARLKALGYLAAPTAPQEQSRGPFMPFERLPLVQTARDVVIVAAAHPNFGSLVGVIDPRRGTITSTGRAGYLQYGPYVELSSGDYDITWLGSIQPGQAGDAVFDVVHGRGALRIAGETVHFDGGGRPEGVLLTVRFLLKEGVPDAEFRVYVGKGMRLEISAVRIRAVR